MGGERDIFALGHPTNLFHNPQLRLYDLIVSCGDGLADAGIAYDCGGHGRVVGMG